MQIASAFPAACGDLTIGSSEQARGPRGGGGDLRLERGGHRDVEWDTRRSDASALAHTSSTASTRTRRLSPLPTASTVAAAVEVPGREEVGAVLLGVAAQAEERRVCGAVHGGGAPTELAPGTALVDGGGGFNDACADQRKSGSCLRCLEAHQVIVVGSATNINALCIKVYINKDMTDVRDRWK
ncbi:uncharacterized protein LOC133903691 [Phragmites australis]|uniref:uncharacterized protein LOC133903691 n=1 Tax=Phragmites australis TaxID=29695 RepID=UPI002D794A1E|nr:uncharacterized protein LOC133903691 [Phragmites australis]XP_062201116.1 uncharacterized protein LOC133903691 [Phragmites australis]